MTSEPMWMTLTARQNLETELAQLERASRDDATSLARAREVRALLRRAQVDRKPDDGLVEPGMLVTVSFDHDDTVMTFLLGSRTLAELDPNVTIDVYSPTSPLGAAINGRHTGDVVEVDAPSGRQRVTIREAVPFR